MKGKRVFLSLLLVLSMVFSMAFSVSAARSPKEIIQSILNYYRYYESDAMTDVYRLLDELEAVDPEQADDWRKIMEKWEYAVNELESPFGALPDGLPEDDTLCIVVMGYVLNPDGSMRDELVGRCQVALNSWKKYPNAYIICTGGGTASGNGNATEAGQMVKWLIEHGVDESKVIEEMKSLSSEQNALNSVNILKQEYPQVDSIALISSDYHLRRCYVLFEAALALNDWDGDYTIVGTAGYDATQLGDEGPKIEAESIGLMKQVYLGGLKKPTLSVLDGILVDGATEYTAGDELNISVTALYNGDYSRDVTAHARFVGHDMDIPGEQTVTVIYDENGISSTASFSISVAPAPTEAATRPDEPGETQTGTGFAEMQPPTPAKQPGETQSSTGSAEMLPPTPAKQPGAESDKNTTDTPPLWLLLIPLLVAVILIFKVNEMVQKKRRRKRRPRKRMEWD